MGTISWLDLHKLKGSEFWSQKTFFFSIFGRCNNAHSVGLEITIVPLQINHSEEKAAQVVPVLLLQGSTKPQLEGHFDGEIYFQVISVLSEGEDSEVPWLAGRMVMADTQTSVTAEITLCGYLSTKRCLYHWLNSHFTQDGR